MCFDEIGGGWLSRYPLLHQGTNGTGAGGIGTDRGTSTGTCTGTSTGTGTPKLEMVSGHPRPPSAIKAVSVETDLV